MISGALVSILVGLAASNLGIIPHDAPAYSAVFQYLLPLTIPLLLFRADLRQVVRTTGTLFLAFLLGSGASFIYTFIIHIPICLFLYQTCLIVAKSKLSISRIPLVSDILRPALLKSLWNMILE